MSGSGILKLALGLAFLLFLGLLCLAVLALRQALPATHPLQQKLTALTSMKLSKLAQALAALLLAAYFLGALLLYG